MRFSKIFQNGVLTSGLTWSWRWPILCDGPNPHPIPKIKFKHSPNSLAVARKSRVSLATREQKVEKSDPGPSYDPPPQSLLMTCGPLRTWLPSGHLHFLIISCLFLECWVKRISASAVITACSVLFLKLKLTTQFVWCRQPIQIFRYRLSLKADGIWVAISGYWLTLTEHSHPLSFQKEQHAKKLPHTRVKETLL